MSDERQLFIAWVPYQRRTELMHKYFGFELRHIGWHFGSHKLRVVEYFLKFFQTVFYLIGKRPQVLWTQIAPTPLLHAAHLYKALFNRKLVILSDCHSSVFRAPWVKTPMLVRLLNRNALVLVHNAWVMQSAIEQGVSEDLLIVLETRPTTLDRAAVGAPQTQLNHPLVLHPCAFAEDEPIAEAIESGRFMPEVTLAISGDWTKLGDRKLVSNAPPNVKFLGYLPKAEYERLLCAADAVLGLTIYDGVQLSVANEAVGVGAPMILSDTRVLRELFNKGAIYVDSLSPEKIAEGCREALERSSELKVQVATLRQERLTRWQAQADTVTRRIAAREQAGDPVLQA